MYRYGDQNHKVPAEIFWNDQKNKMKYRTQLSWQRCSYWNVTKDAGGHLNKKDGLTRYGDSHVKDKTS